MNDFVCVCLLLGALLLSPPPLAAAQALQQLPRPAPPPSVPADLTTLSLLNVVSLMSHRAPEVRQRAQEELKRRNDSTAVPALIELLRIPRYHDFPEITALLEELTGQKPGSDWAAWSEWLTARESVALPPDFLPWKAALFRLLDPAFEKFLNPRARLRIRVEEIVWGGVKKDGIPALTNPKQLKAAEATYLTPEELVFGVEINGEARAYPHRLMDWHELVNDVVGGVPVALVYCTLCRSGVLFDARAGGRTFTFGSSGLLYRSNKLMYDHETESLWMTIPGEPVGGALAASGLRLQKLPVVITTWRDWAKQHPDTLVLSLETGYQRDYTPGAAYGEYFASPKTWYPVARRDNRLPPKEEVYTLMLNDQPKAYAVAALRGQRVLNDTLGGESLVLVADSSTGAVRAYRRGPLRFQAAEGTSDKIQTQDGGLWRLTESALVSENSGQRLARLPGHVAYWFGWYAFFPQTLLYTGSE
ncbi:MAG: DUF3179 domain-containing protein [Candidatus Acidiferrales bacterium]